MSPPRREEPPGFTWGNSKRRGVTETLSGQSSRTRRSKTLDAKLIAKTERYIAEQSAARTVAEYKAARRHIRPPLWVRLSPEAAIDWDLRQIIAELKILNRRER